MSRLIADPLPAASRPSNTTTRRFPVSRSQACISTSSAWSRLSSFSYSFLGSFSSPLGSSSLESPFAPPPVLALFVPLPVLALFVPLPDADFFAPDFLSPLFPLLMGRSYGAAAPRRPHTKNLTVSETSV